MKIIRYGFLAITFSMLVANAGYAVPLIDAKKTMAANKHSTSALSGTPKNKGSGINGTGVGVKSTPQLHK